MTVSEAKSIWERYPDHRVDLVPCHDTVRVWHGDRLLAESRSCIRVVESKHVDRMYFPEADVRWELFEPTAHHTICPFKGDASYWTLAGDPPEENVVWAYHEPVEQVAGLRGHVAFYQERLRIEVQENWPGEPDPLPARRLQVWGDENDLVRLLDVEPAEPGRFTGAPYGQSASLVEGGHLLGQAIVAASKTIPAQRVSSAYMIFSKSASFDAPLELDVEVVRGGRTYSTVEVRVSQADQVRSVGLLLLDAAAPDVYRGAAEMPDVPGPDQAAPLDWAVSGRDLRVVDGAYDPDPERIGPAELYAWVRFRDAPAHQHLHAALVAQSTTHWTVAASMRPHQGFGVGVGAIRPHDGFDSRPDDTLSTAPMTASIAFHDDIDVTQWLLYANPSTYAGRGHAQGEGRVFTQGGRLVASYSVHAMVRWLRAPSTTA
jgi:acyl-CoA thioesterase-2